MTTDKETTKELAVQIVIVVIGIVMLVFAAKFIVMVFGFIAHHPYLVTFLGAGIYFALRPEKSR